jgi:hypothetical protein
MNFKLEQVDKKKSRKVFGGFWGSNFAIFLWTLKM